MSRRGLDQPRVLYFYSWLHLDTGSPRALVSLVDSLGTQEFSPLFLANGDGPLVGALRQRGVEIVPGNVTAVTPRRPWSAIAAVRRQLQLLDSLGVDLLHIHEPGWNFDLVIAARLRRIPVVLHVHNPVSVWRRNLHWMLADRVVFVSEAHRSSTEHLRRIAPKTTVICNSVDVERFAQGRSLRGEFGLGDEDFVVGTVAQLSRRKGIDLLLDTAAALISRHPGVAFLIAGPAAKGEESFVSDIRARAADPMFKGRLRLLGPRSDIPDFLATCDLFCLPSRAEPLGIAVIEAMAAGLPVVASRVGGIPEIITTPQHGCLVAREAADDFAQAIAGIMLSPDRGRSMGEAGRESLLGRFDPRAVGSRWRSLYAELLSPRAVR